MSTTSRVRRVIVPSLHQKHLDTWVSTFFAAVHVAFSDNDIVLLCNVANSRSLTFRGCLASRSCSTSTASTASARSGSGLGAQVLHFCEWMSSFSSSQLVTDAKAIHDYYLAKYGSESAVIGYGSEMPAGEYSLNGLNLDSGRYVLYVSRLEPENNPDLVLRSWRNVRSDWPLVMVGDNPYDPGYLDRLKTLGDDRVRFTGAIYGDGYWALQKHAGVFVFACEVGGVHPALIEAMAASNPVLYLDTPENAETAGDAAIRYEKSEADLTAKLQSLLDDAASPPATRPPRQAARRRTLSLGSYRREVREAVRAPGGEVNRYQPSAISDQLSALTQIVF